MIKWEDLTPSEQEDASEAIKLTNWDLSRHGLPEITEEQLHNVKNALCDYYEATRKYRAAMEKSLKTKPLYK